MRNKRNTVFKNKDTRSMHLYHIHVYGISVWDGNAFHTANKEK